MDGGAGAGAVGGASKVVREGGQCTLRAVAIAGGRTGKPVSYPWLLYWSVVKPIDIALFKELTRCLLSQIS